MFTSPPFPVPLHFRELAQDTTSAGEVRLLKATADLASALWTVLREAGLGGSPYAALEIPQAMGASFDEIQHKARAGELDMWLGLVAAAQVSNAAEGTLPAAHLVERLIRAIEAVPGRKHVRVTRRGASTLFQGFSGEPAQAGQLAGAISTAMDSFGSAIVWQLDSERTACSVYAALLCFGVWAPIPAGVVRRLLDTDKCGLKAGCLSAPEGLQ